MKSNLETLSLTSGRGFSTLTMTPVRRHTLFALYSAALIVLAFEPIRRLILVSLDWDNSHVSYIPLIPLISGALILGKREKIFRDLRTSFGPTVGAFAIGGTLYYAAWKYGPTVGENDQLALLSATVLAFWLGGFLLFYGSAAFRNCLFPLMFLVLVIPIPDRLMEGFVRLLQHGSSDMVSILMTLTGTPVYRESRNVFALPKVTIEVAEACSGIRSTLTMLIVTLLAAHLSLKTNWKKTVLLLAVIPVSLFKNAVRIVTLTLLAIHYDMKFLSGSLHHDGGVVFMVGGLFLLYPILAVLVRSEGVRS